MKAFFVSIAALLSMLWVASAAWAQQQTGSDYGPHMWGGGSWMIFGPIMMIVFIAVAVVVVVLLVRWLGGPGRGGALHSPPGKTPLDILKERFAKGEIDKEEFEERRRVLGE
jgi:putative membrane protein